jgi:competence protein ComEC
VGKALLLGIREGLSPEFRKALQRAGTSHLLAISGFHVGLLYAGVWMAASLLGPGRARRLAPSLTVLTAYVNLTGAIPSVTRAVLAANLHITARLLGRKSAPAASVAAVFIALVSISPASAADLSLQLSFLAAAALVGYAGPVASLGPAPSWIILPLAVNVVAVTATAPLTASLFNRVTPGALAANLVAVPLMAAGYVSSLLAPVLGLLPPALAALGLDVDPDLSPQTLLAGVAARAFEGARAASAWVSAIPGMSYSVCTPPGWMVAATVAAGALVAARELDHRFRVAALAAGALLLTLIILPTEKGSLNGVAPGGKGVMSATFFDVGQGSSALVETPAGNRILVDAGGFARSAFDVGERVVARSLLSMGILRVDAVMISHRDFDHIGGAAAILDLFDGGEIWLAPSARSSIHVTRLIAMALERGRTLRLLSAGRRFRFGGAEIDVFHPPAREACGTTNNCSLVLSVRTPGGSLLLPGDIEEWAESRLAGSLSPVDLLLAAHHGSRTSSTRLFLQALTPRWVVVSCGSLNHYGHPHPSALRRLREAGARVLRTDLHGAVRAVFSGHGNDRGRGPLLFRFTDGQWAGLDGTAVSSGQDADGVRDE